MDRLRRLWALAAVTAGGLGISLSLLLGGAFGAAAATGASASAAATTTGATAAQIFGCRASLASVSIAGMTLAEPGVANSGITPCNDNSSAVSQLQLLGDSSPLNLGTVGPAGEETYETGALGDGVADEPGATAVSTINALQLNLPGGFTISVGGPSGAPAAAASGIQSQAAVYCNGTTLATAGSSTVQAVTIAGPGIPNGSETLDVGNIVNDDLTPLTGPTGALAAVANIVANEQVVSGDTFTENALDIKLLADNVQVLIGSSEVTAPTPGICADNTPQTETDTVTTPGAVTTVTGADGTVTTVTTPGATETVTGANGTVTTVTGPSTTTTITEPSGSVPTAFEECTPNSVYDPTTGDCVIYVNGQPVYVSKPFEGPSGGTVISLPEAKAKYKSPCLSGSGPGWVLIVSGVGKLAKGTQGPDRIIGLNARETIEGLNGDDCVDAKGSHSKVTDGNGKDRDYVTSGYSRVIVGNGNDHVYGRNASGWITAGTGTDHIYGGKAGMRIDAYGNKKYIFGSKGKNRIWSNSQVAQIHCGGNKKTVLFARRNPARYAAKHGCHKIKLLH